MYNMIVEFYLKKSHKFELGVHTWGVEWKKGKVSFKIHYDFPNMKYTVLKEQTSFLAAIMYYRQQMFPEVPFYRIETIVCSEYQ